MNISVTVSISSSAANSITPICFLGMSIKLVMERTIKAMTTGLRRENEILDGFLPRLLTKEEIKNHLNSVATEIMSAKSDGQATGVAVGVFKKAGLAVDGSDVSEIVKKMREV
jgi:uncharacterized protein YqeY